MRISILTPAQQYYFKKSLNAEIQRFLKIVRLEPFNTKEYKEVKKNPAPCILTYNEFVYTCHLRMRIKQHKLVLNSSYSKKKIFKNRRKILQIQVN